MIKIQTRTLTSELLLLVAAFVIFSGEVTARTRAWVAAVAIVSIVVVGKFLLVPPRIEEGHNVFLPGGPMQVLQRELPAEVYRRLATEFDAQYPPAAVLLFALEALVGGGPDEVFVGYHGIDEMPTTMTCPPKDPTQTIGYGDYCDPNHHSGKMDRVRLQADGTLDVARFDFVAGRQGAEFWHNRTVQSLAYDHFVHPHTLYVGANHGVIMLFPDRFRYPRPGEWFDLANVEWMGDHLHARVCQPGPCPTDREGPQRMGDWAGVAIDASGDLWHAGRWTAGAITWDPDPIHWVERNGAAFKAAFGVPYPEAPDDEGFTNEPVFKVNAEGDSVFLSGVAVCPDGRVWFSSHGPQNGTSHTVAVWKGRSFDTFDAAALGLGGPIVNAIACLPDGRVVLGGADSGLSLYDPASGKSVAIRAGSGLPDDRVLALEVDRMVKPFALHVATAGGGRGISLARRRRFWAIAASVNSNWAPRGPRNRSRPSRRMRFR